MRSAVVIYNPRAGQHDAARLISQTVAALRVSGFDAAPRATAGPGDATTSAASAALEPGLDAIFALGGDGTLREAAAGLIDTGIALGFLPAGTVNVMALALGIPPDPVAAARLAGQLEPRPFDVGLCAERPFLMMASFGLDAQIMAAQSPALKRRIGRAAIGVGALHSWWRYAYPGIDVYCGGEAVTRARLVVISNIPFYGGRFRIAPDADPCDGLLDAVLFHGRGRRAALAFAHDLVRGRHLDRPDVELVRTPALEIRGTEEATLQLDGDALRAVPPIAITVAPKALTLLAAPL